MAKEESRKKEESARKNREGIAEPQKRLAEKQQLKEVEQQPRDLTGSFPSCSTAQDWLEAVSVFEGDEETLREHFAEIEAERQRQYEEANQQGAE